MGRLKKNFFEFRIFYRKFRFFLFSKKKRKNEKIFFPDSKKKSELGKKFFYSWKNFFPISEFFWNSEKKFFSEKKTKLKISEKSSWLKMKLKKLEIRSQKLNFSEKYAFSNFFNFFLKFFSFSILKKNFFYAKKIFSNFRIFSEFWKFFFRKKKKEKKIQKKSTKFVSKFFSDFFKF